MAFDILNESIMNVIDHRKFARRPRRRLPSRAVIRGVLVVAGAVLLVNVGLAVVYAGKALPGYRLGNVSVGGKAYGAIDTMLSEQNDSALKLTISKEAQKQVVMAKDLGVTIDKKQSLQRLKDARPFLPMLSWFTARQVSLVVHADEATFAKQTDAMATVFMKEPLQKRLVFADSSFRVADPISGYKLDKTRFKTAVTRAVGKQQTAMTAPVVEVKALEGQTDLSAEQAKLEAQVATKITFVIGAAKIQPTKADIGAWYTTTGQTMVPDKAKIMSYVSDIAHKQGSAATNKSDIAIATTYLLSKKLNQSLLVTNQGAKLHTYCTATRGVTAAEMPDLIGKLAATYADPRGWTADGAIAFEHVESDCQYTVWLTAPSQMTSFGAICDSYYNCQVGSNVIVNNDRWLYATDAWNKTGQDIETYRLLIINHETGHRLGFRDNPVCPGAGQPAPVMMQQSISLEGCTFNPWPVAGELDTVKSML